MSNYINGYGYPVFKIYNSSNTLLATYSFPYTNEGGCLEENIPRYKTAVNINNTKYSVIKGWHKKWTLHYDNFIKLTDSLNLAELLKYFASESYQRIFYPRNDNYLYKFDVNCTNASFLLGILKGGLYAPGNKGIIIELETRTELTELGWMNPTLTPRYIGRLNLNSKFLIKTDS